MDPTLITSIEGAVVDLAHKAGQVATQYGPQAMDIAIQYTHALAVLSAIQDLLVVIATAVLWTVFFKYLFKFIAFLRGDGEEWAPALIIFGIIGFFGALGTIAVTGGAISDFFSPATFFGLFEPKLAVLHFVLTQVGK